MTNFSARQDEARKAAKELAAAYYSVYSDYNKTLRTWFVTFGLGGPSLFLVNEKLGSTLATSRLAWWVVGLFIAGCIIQVTIAIINKNCGYFNYRGAAEAAFKESKRYKRWKRVSVMYGLDMWADILTGIFYIAALALLTIVFLLHRPTPQAPGGFMWVTALISAHTS